MKYREDELNTIKDRIIDWEVDLTDPRLDLKVLAEQFYSSEFNYNNADTTSGQICFLESDILSMLDVITDSHTI